MEWLSDHMWAAWLGLSMVLGVAELFSLDLVLLMLAVGAMAGMVMAVLGLPVAVQVIAAVAASVGMLAFVRPTVVKRLHAGPDLRSGTAALIGTTGFALEEVTERSGQVKLSGEVWTARPYDEHAVIPSGSKIEVFEIKGATAYVAQVPEFDHGLDS